MSQFSEQESQKYHSNIRDEDVLTTCAYELGQGALLSYGTQGDLAQW